LKNVVYFATENDSVYALDAASITGSTATVLWQKSVLQPGETAANALPACGVTTGVMATPVIDRARNAIYVVAMSQDSNKTAYQRIYALDLTTGNPLFGGPTTIAATHPGTGANSKNGIVTFNPSLQHERAALLETGNTIYTVRSGLNGDWAEPARQPTLPEMCTPSRVMDLAGLRRADSRPAASTTQW
jgi:hypothetical protein